MGKWTPGKWEPKLVGNYASSVIGVIKQDFAGVYEVRSDGCKTICEFATHSDARLIAAAPEMAELLQKMLDRAGQLDPFTEQEARALLSRLEDK